MLYSIYIIFNGEGNRISDFCFHLVSIARQKRWINAFAESININELEHCKHGENV